MRNTQLFVKPTAGGLNYTETDNTINIKGSGVALIFDKKIGEISSYSFNGKLILEHGAQPDFWRPLVDNDYGAGYNRRNKVWRDPGLKVTALAVKKLDNGNIEVSFEKSLLSGDATYKQKFVVDGSGKNLVSNDMKAGKAKQPVLLKFGNHMLLPTDFTTMEWYGRGPGESYLDRKSANIVGVYKKTIDALYHPYVRPQESGNRTDVRWAKLLRKDGSGVMIGANETVLSVNALPFSPSQLDAGDVREAVQTHSELLEPDKHIHLDVDLIQAGVGGVDSWGSPALPQYRIPYKDYSYSYWIIPIKK